MTVYTQRDVAIAILDYRAQHRDLKLRYGRELNLLDRMQPADPHAEKMLQVATSCDPQGTFEEWEAINQVLSDYEKRGES